MPNWGDKNHNWKAIDDCVEILYEELGDLVCQAKEKFGFVRCYMSHCTPDGEPYDTECFPEKYRNAYKKCLDKYPEMAYYILMDADYPEYLKGLVKEEDCDHPGGWVKHDKDGSKTFTCGVCGQEEENYNDNTR